MIDKENAYKVIRENAGATNEYIGKLLGVSEKTIRRYKKEINFVAPASTPQQEIDAVRQNTAYNNLKQKYNKLLQVLDEKDAALAQYESISEKPEDISLSVKKGKKREVVPVIVASDWHIEETVSAAITNGLNEYNLTIAEDSIKQFFNNACTLVKQTKENSIVNTIVLALLGDIINGVLREEDFENNQVTTVDAISLARTFLYNGIKKLANDTGCNIRVICCVGNHARMTDKIHYANQVHNNLEYMLYQTLERDFKKYDKVEFNVAEGPYVIQRIFGIDVRFHHGHFARYNGGIGGLAIPVLRKVAQMNTIEKADLDVIGHFHSMQVFSNVIINGSLVGSNGYSMALGFPYEPPQQTFFLIDSKYGRSMITPIFIDRKVSKTTVNKI